MESSTAIKIGGVSLFCISDVHEVYKSEIEVKQEVVIWCDILEHAF